MGNRVSDIKETRTVLAGSVNDVDKRRTNRIKTSKYSIITFIPKNLIEQFRRLANFYFLIVTLIAVVIDSPVSPFTSLSPLIFVIFVSMAKQGYEDWLRHRADNVVNNELVSIIHNSALQQVRRHQLRPGELVKITRDCDVPCDAVLLWSSDSRGKCFVTTANLDGETSLKTLKVPSTLAHTHVGNVSSMNVTIEFLPPEPDIYTFHGKISLEDQKPIPIGTENLLLRGSRIKNTEWAIGCAIYTGKETKLALNSKFKSNKFTSTEAHINNFLLFFIILMVLEIVISFVLKRIYEGQGHEYYLGPSPSAYSFSSITQDMFSFLLLYYYSIPISLYVTIEFHRFIGSKFFEWDEDFYCHETGQMPLVNSSDLNEELGQIEILFSDKTGTLTKNDMYFQKCSINGDLFIEKNEKLFEINEQWLSGNISQPILSLTPQMDFFFTALALCHTVQIEDEPTYFANNFSRSKYTVQERKKNIPIYQSMSADEIAFVKAAANRGIIFNGDDFNNLLLKYNDGTVKSYQKLQTLEFTSTRRRMSVIVKDPSGKIFLFCKGAESAILPLCLDSPLIATTNDHVQNFAEQGLRTLAVAYKELTEEQYLKIEEEITKYNNDITAQLNKEVTNHWRSIENDLILLGATGVEDRLQDDVAETMKSLRQAGVKIWVLTGDKVETAINVAQSCGHIPHNSQKIFLTEILTRDELLPQLMQCIEDAKVANKAHLTLIIDGQTLQLIFGIPEEVDFIEMTLKCKAVVCCRLSPLQKAEIVKLVKKSSHKPVTAAIGDGANDISMIQEAHVGFGIFGKEGRQAARAADFSFPKFNMLKKAFLVHGHWYYERLATLIQYSFYKNFVFTNLMLFFEINTLFSTQTYYDSFFLTFFNLVFASAPILVLSLTEKCHLEEDLMKNPKLYKNQRRNKLLCWKYFFGWCLSACYHSVVIYCFLYAIWHINPVINTDGGAAGLWCFGSASFHCLVILINLKIWFQGKYQTLIFILSILLTILAFIGLTWAYSYMNFLDDGDLLGVYIRLLGSPSFWLVNVLIVVASLQPDIIFHTMKKMRKLSSQTRAAIIDDYEITRL